MSIEHSIQFALSVRGGASYGLWWHCWLAQCNWDRLETKWMKMLKMAVHEKCPASVKIATIYDITGLHSFRAFSDYLVHYRTVDQNLNPGRRDFTLKFTELQQFRNISVDRTAPKNLRQSTLDQTTSSLTNRARKLLIGELGSVKAHTIEIAQKKDWEEADFKLKKFELRKKYGIKRNKPTKEIRLPKDDLLEFLKVHAFQVDK